MGPIVLPVAIPRDVYHLEIFSRPRMRFTVHVGKQRRKVFGSWLDKYGSRRGTRKHQANSEVGLHIIDGLETL